MRPKIISLGDDWRSWPQELWGSRDWQEHMDEQRRGLGKTAGVQPATQPGELRFGLFPARVEGGARSQGIDKMLDSLGIGPKRGR